MVVKRQLSSQMLSLAARLRLATHERTSVLVVNVQLKQYSKDLLFCQELWKLEVGIWTLERTNEALISNIQLLTSHFWRLDVGFNKKLS